LGGDITRSTFVKKKHYRKVKMQQGRVQIDADWNEQVDIDSHHEKTFLGDLAGASGTPVDSVTGYGDGFKVAPASAQPGAPSSGAAAAANAAPAGGPAVVEASAGTVAAPFTPAPYQVMKGRYYVDGILCENEETISVDQQPDLPLDSSQQNNPIPSAPGLYVAYLDVWDRELTCIEDPQIREVALLGPDTATRSKTIWQVKLLGVGQLPAPPAQPPSGQPALSLSPGLGAAGTSFTIIGSGFAAGEQVALSMGAAGVTRNLVTSQSAPKTDANGSFTATFLVPRLPDGQYTIMADGFAADDTASATFMVVGCGDYDQQWQTFLAQNESTGRLRARAIPPQPTAEPCVLPPQAGYVGLENQLYRVEVHGAGMILGPAIPLFRLYNAKNGHHLYTISSAERQNDISSLGYTDEGSACYVFGSDPQVPGSAPLFRLYNPTNGDNFYTTSATERDNAVANGGYTDAGVACYVFTTNVLGTSPLYRLYNATSGDHFYTVSASERDNATKIGYTLEGTACYVFASDPQAALSQLLPTFKWSRDNGTVLAKVTTIDETSSVLSVGGTGKDGNMGFAGEPGQAPVWVEVTSDSLELWNMPGSLAELKDVGDGTLTFDPATATSPVTNAAFPETAGRKVRRWDCSPAPCAVDSPDNYGYLQLENGVEVRFEAGTYHTGDYWLIPARTATANVEWPQETDPVNWNNITTPTSPNQDATTLMDYLVQILGTSWIEGSQFVQNAGNPSEVDISGSGHSLALTMNQGSTEVAVAVDGTVAGTIPVVSQSGSLMLQCVFPAPLLAKGIEHHFERLAVLQCDAAGAVTLLTDCRELFPALTDVTRLTYVSGDGQVAGPNGSLPFPLMAAAPLGQVRFTIVVGSGTLSDPTTGATAQGPGAVLDIIPDKDGIAGCNWTLDTSSQAQRVEADLLDLDGGITERQPLYFNAFLAAGGAGVAAPTAITGLLELVVSDTNGNAVKPPVNYGPFKHQVQNATAPPAIMLAYVGFSIIRGYTVPGFNEGQVLATEDEGLYGSGSLFAPAVPQFKAVAVDTNSFMVYLDRVTLPRLPPNYKQSLPIVYTLVLRWWAIPAQEAQVDPQSGTPNSTNFTTFVAGPS
jgi:hypothetical protein